MVDDIKVVTGGMDGFVRQLRSVRSRPARKRIMKSAMTSAMKPIKTGFRRDVRRAKAVRLRFLAKSIKDKVKVFPDGNVFGIVGAERKLHIVNGVRINPANYIHLADQGTEAHGKKKSPDKPWRFKDLVTGRWRTLKGKRHPGAKAKPFREQVARRYGFIAQWVFARRFGMLLTRELKKQGG